MPVKGATPATKAPATPAAAATSAASRNKADLKSSGVAPTPPTDKKASSKTAASSSSSAAAPKDALVDEEAYETSSSEDDEKAPQKRQSIAFRARKFMTSKVGETRMGRATVSKVLGDDGDTILQAIKSLTSKMTSRKEAKENKRDSVRFLLKAYNLWKHKDILVESTRQLQRDAQILAELFGREVDTRAMGKRELGAIGKVAARIHDCTLELFRPHLQDKNAARLSELIRFYASTRFLSALLNSPAGETECAAIDSAISNLLMPFPTILTGEGERMAVTQLKQQLRVLESPVRLEAFIEHPPLVALFQTFLDLDLGRCSKNTLRFFLAVRDYEKISARSLLKIRAPKIVEKFLLSNAELRVDGVSDAALQEVLRALDEPNVAASAFAPVIAEVRSALVEDFEQQFLTSADFRLFKEGLLRDLQAALQLLADETG